MFVICVSQWSATRLDVFGAESRAPDWRTTMFFVLVIPWRRARAWFWVQSTLTLGKCCALVSHHYFPVGVKYLWRDDWKRQILGKSADITVKLEYLFIYFANRYAFVSEYGWKVSPADVQNLITGQDQLLDLCDIIFLYFVLSSKTRRSCKTDIYCILSCVLDRTVILNIQTSRDNKIYQFIVLLTL